MPAASTRGLKRSLSAADDDRPFPYTIRRAANHSRRARALLSPIVAAAPPTPRHYESPVVVEPAVPSGVCRRCLALHMSPRVVLPQLAVLMRLTWAGTRRTTRCPQGSWCGPFAAVPRRTTWCSQGRRGLESTLGQAQGRPQRPSIPPASSELRRAAAPRSASPWSLTFTARQSLRVRAPRNDPWSLPPTWTTNPMKSMR